MEKTLNEKFNDVRNEILKHYVDKNANDAGVMLYAYIHLQIAYDQANKKKEDRLPDTDSLCQCALLLAQHGTELMADFGQLLADKDNEHKDFFMHFVYPVIRQFGKDNKPENEEDDSCYVDLNDTHEYMCAIVGLLLRSQLEQWDSEKVMQIMRDDEIGNFSYSATNPQQIYEWIKQEYDMPSSDPGHFFNKMRDFECDEESEEVKQVKETINAIGVMMKRAMPIFCGTTLSGCKTEDEQKVFRKRLDEMLEQEYDGMSKMFTIGLMFVSMIPDGHDMFERLNTHEKCIEFFNAFYGVMAGQALKDFYEPLNDEDKNVARCCFLGGFLTSLTKIQLSEDGEGFLGLKFGAAYDLPGNIKDLIEGE